MTRLWWGRSTAAQPAEADSGGSHDFARFSDTSAAKADLKRNAVRGFSQTLALGAAEFALRLAFTAVLARLVSPEQFGLFMVVAAVTAIADQFRDLGLSTATIQRENITHQEVSNLFWINAAAGVLLAVVISALSPLVSLYFREPRLTAVTIALASTFVLSSLSVQHEALLGRQMRLGPKAVMRLVAFTISSGVATAMAMADYGYWSLVWREIVRSALIVAAAWVLCRWVPSRPRAGTDVRALVRFGSGLTATYMLTSLASGLDRFLLGRLQGAAVVGLYRQSYQLVMAPMAQLMGPLYQVSLPSMSMLQDQPDRFRRAYARIVSIVATVSMPLGVLIAICADEITSVVLGPRWSGAGTFIRIFAVGALVQSVFSTMGFVLVSLGRSAELLKLTIVHTAWRVALMSAGAVWGGYGVAVADVASTATAFLPFLHWAMRGSAVSTATFLTALARPFFASVFLAGALALLRAFLPAGAPATSLAASVGLTLLAFPAAVILLPGGRADVKAVSSMVTSLMIRARE
ncbi:Lipopolysaccharide biosynthesis protein WzxC [Luteitalea pratensis]|uniref:Lipopolysaccharide biosynthesis protein WzxC n=1 Tax=Luteitalea pratensis TaxID=1855912 RepID=A0A143PWL2_LUTPR|nr:lipopolysaccharide biosynthesis protein [Luteitalea pratensis]AMY12962.1 Lipopolysaccharide biosynthesis protein WzxC [Luteitalea pratensis]